MKLIVCCVLLAGWIISLPAQDLKSGFPNFQEKLDTSIGFRLKDTMTDADITYDDGIVTVGLKATNDRGNPTDVLVVKMTGAGNQIQTYRQTLGDPAAADSSCAVLALPGGQIWVAGKSVYNNGQAKFWIKALDISLDLIGETQIDSIQEAGARITDMVWNDVDQTVSLVITAPRKIYYKRFHTDRQAFLNEEITSLEGYEGVKFLPGDCKMLLHDGTLYLAMQLETNKADEKLHLPKQDRLFVVKTTVSLEEKEIRIVEKSYPLVHIGSISMSSDNRLMIVGTCIRDDNREEEYFIQSYSEFFEADNVYENGSFGKDYGVAVIEKKKQEFMLFGWSYSQRPGSNTSNILILPFKRDGLNYYSGEYNKKDLYYGKERDESIVAAFRLRNGSVWLCGTIDNGLWRNDDFYFVKAGVLEGEKPVMPATDNQPASLVVKEKALPARPADLTPGMGTEWAFDISNPTAQSFAPLVFEISCSKAGDMFEFPLRMITDEIRPTRTNTLKIPVKIRENAIAGEYTFDVKVRDSNGKELYALQKQLKVVPVAQADLVIQMNCQTDAKGYITRGLRATCRTVVFNRGNFTSTPGFIRFQVPDLIPHLGPDQQTISSIAPGDSAVVFFDILPPNDYLLPQIEIIARAAEGTGTEVVEGRCTALLANYVAGNQTLPANPPPATGTADIYINIVGHNNEIEVTTQTGTYPIHILINSAVPVERNNIVIRINGEEKLLIGEKMDEIPLKPVKNGLEFDYTVPLQEDTNRIQVIVRKGNKEIFSDEIRVLYNKPCKLSSLYVLSIGIADRTESIKFPQKDARDFADLFRGQREYYKNIDVRQLTEPDSTERKPIYDAIGYLIRDYNLNIITENDVVMIFLSSHGQEADNGGFAIHPSDYNPYFADETSINFESIVDKLKEIKAHKILFIDACHSGSVASGSYAGVKGSEGDNAYDKALENLKKSGTDVHIITSCNKNQSSYEDSAWSNGAFTKVILDVLKDPVKCRQLDKDADNAVSTVELYEYLKTEVPKLVKTKYNKDQVPFMPEYLLQSDAHLPIYWIPK